MTDLIEAKNRVKSAKLSYDFGHYDRAIEYTKEAFQYSTASFIIGVTGYFTIIIFTSLYFFL